MSKRNIVRKIQVVQAEITNLESKRSRSMAVILDALVRKEDPNPVELMYFRTFSAEIDEKREYIQELMRQLNEQLA